MIFIIGRLAVEQIVSESMASGCFPIMLDETTDPSTSEIFLIFLRCVHRPTGFIKEMLVHMSSLPVCDAESLCQFVDEFFNSAGLLIEMMRGQSYDGASFMQGACDGMATKLLDKAKQAVRTWYCCHRLALVAEDSCK